MSALESTSREVLAPAIRGEAVEWTREGQAAVARWAFKTALMLDFAGVHPTIPLEHYREFHQRRRPVASSRIWSTSYAPAGDDEFQSAWMNSHALTLHLENRERRAYTMTFNVGYLVFQILGFEGADDLTVEKRRFTDTGRPGEDFLIPIWPVRLMRASWPPSYAFDARGLLVLSKPTFARF